MILVRVGGVAGAVGGVIVVVAVDDFNQMSDHCYLYCCCCYSWNFWSGCFCWSCCWSCCCYCCSDALFSSSFDYFYVFCPFFHGVPSRLLFSICVPFSARSFLLCASAPSPSPYLSP